MSFLHSCFHVRLRFRHSWQSAVMFAPPVTFTLPLLPIIIFNVPAKLKLQRLGVYKFSEHTCFSSLLFRLCFVFLCFHYVLLCFHYVHFFKPYLSCVYCNLMCICLPQLYLLYLMCICCSGVPRNFVRRGGGSTNSVEDRGQREQGSGGGSPLVRCSGGSCNLVQEISFHIVKFS